MDAIDDLNNIIRLHLHFLFLSFREMDFSIQSIKALVFVRFLSEET